MPASPEPTPLQPDGPADPPRSRLDPARLPVARPSRRHVSAAGALVVVAWIAITLARQVGDASAASARADALRASNGALREDVAALQRELDTVSSQRFVDLQARAYGLGTSREIPFALAAGAPTLPPDAPGSASVRLGSEESRSPLETWLEVLFGPGD
jgi:hypothetical protein